MCGFVASLAAGPVDPEAARRALDLLRPRGPDDEGSWQDPSGHCWMGHRRLSIIDLSAAGRQPFADASGRYRLVFNGEIYNYLELKEELRGRYPFATATDTEVLLAAYLVWGEACLDRFVGMFAFAIWDSRERRLFAVRDRFGVKPLFYAADAAGGLHLASEIKSLHALGVPRVPDETAWCSYLRDALYDHDERTFWKGVRRVPPGHCLRWTPGGNPEVAAWYDVAERVGAAEDRRPEDEVKAELEHLLRETLMLRFRADVPVGICLSGGLDSSLLLGLICRHFPADRTVQAFTFHCGDERYDETPWVELMVRDTQVHANYCRLCAEDIPGLARAVQASQDEPFGGFPTLGMAKVHARARELGVTVLLDGNGVDEGWAGYDYYQRAADVPAGRGPVQGTRSGPTHPDVLRPEFGRLAPAWRPRQPFGDPLKDLQYRDLTSSKIPRAMRFADRVSMMFSRELREPFLDHRLLELGLRQPADRKIRGGQGKWLVRQVAAALLPQQVSEAPKRPVQTPQREWLRGPLAGWAEEMIEAALAGWGSDWLDAAAVRHAWKSYREHGADNSFPVWQWINLGLMQATDRRP